MNGLDVFLDSRFAPAYDRYPLVLADIGARGGLKTNWLPARRHLRVLGFEPDTREFERLVERHRSDRTLTFFNTALHNRRGTVPLFVARDRGLTSIFKPDRTFVDSFPEPERFDTTAVIEIPTDTLDNVLAAGGVEDVDFIKADTQGSELYVLEGAQGALSSSVVGVEVEVEFSAIYAGQPLFSDVDTYLRKFGFVLFDLRPCYWKRAKGRRAGGPHGQIIWADALYLRSVPALHAAVSVLPVERGRAKLLKAISVAVLYGYLDYGLEITGASRGLLTPQERDAIERHLANSQALGTVRRFPGQRRIAAAAHRLWRLLRRPEDNAWSVSRAKLGNL